MPAPTPWPTEQELFAVVLTMTDSYDGTGQRETMPPR
jgi:hypothetical protein